MRSFLISVVLLFKVAQLQKKQLCTMKAICAKEPFSEEMWDKEVVFPLQLIKK